MDLARGFRAKNKMKHLHDGELGLDSETLLIIKLPESLVLRVIVRSFLLAIVIVALPCIGPILKGHSSSYVHDYESHSIDVEFLNLLLRDLADEGLIQRGDKGLVLSSGIVGMTDNKFQIMNENEIDMVTEFDLDRQSSIGDEAFDFAFTSSFQNAKLIDRVLKTGGTVAVLLSNYHFNALPELSNYGIVYLRRFSFTIVAMRKSSPADGVVNSNTRRRLCSLAAESKKVALKDLEDALLEPPRQAIARSAEYIKKFRYLPDLLRDSLGGYRRRVFINVGSTEESESTMKWFDENYPKKNQDFKAYNFEMSRDESLGGMGKPNDILDWLEKNVREEEYVVMKAEAEVVEEMIRRRTICLVDELFLECKNQWEDEEKNRGRRPYWECLALYGRLIDEGVAVHQWWN